MPVMALEAEPPRADIHPLPLRSLSASLMFGHCILQVLKGKDSGHPSMTTRNFVLDKGDQLLRVSLDKLMKEENFSFVRSRIRVVRLYRYLLKERYEQFKGLNNFHASTQSIEWLDSILEDCELLFFFGSMPWA